MWQEYARHLYARIGTHFFENLRYEQERDASGDGWIHGQERMYQNLLDGSRAANLLGWQWTVGSAGKPFGFSRWQVEKRAPVFA